MNVLADRYWKEIRSALRLFRLPLAWVPFATGLGALIVALLVAPGREPSPWNWLGLPAIALLLGLAVFFDVARRHPRVASPTARNDLVALALFAFLVGVGLSFFTTFPATIFAVLATCALAAIALRTPRGARHAVLLSGATALVVPIWAWLALDKERWGLVLLVAFAALAWFSDTYMRLAIASDTRESTRATRSLRFLSWLGLLTATVVATLLAITSEIGNTWVVIGAFCAIGCIAGEAGLPQHGGLPGSWSRQLIALGYASLAICWLTSL